MPRIDWIIAHDATQGELAYALECLRCGTVQPIATPISVDAYVAMGYAFQKYHRYCKEETLAKAPRRKGGPRGNQNQSKTQTKTDRIGG